MFDEHCYRRTNANIAHVWRQESRLNLIKSHLHLLGSGVAGQWCSFTVLLTAAVDN